MGKQEDFLHPSTRGIKIQKEKEVALEKRVTDVMSRAIDDFSIDLALEKFGDISYSNEEEFHKLRNSIRIEINQYFETNPDVKRELFHAGMAEKNTQEIIKRGLRNIYLVQIKGQKIENSTSREPNEEEQKKLEITTKSVLSIYLSKQNIDSQRKELSEEPLTRSGMAKDKMLEKRERVAEDFIRSIATNFFRKNNRVPSEDELYALVKTSLEEM